MPTDPAEPTGYRDITNVLRQRLLTAEPGSRVPTEEQLATEFHVNRTTVQRAMRVLKTLGLVESNRGGGTVKSWPPVQIIGGAARIAAALRPDRADPSKDGWQTGLEDVGLTGHARVLRVTIPPADAELAARLGIAEGQLVVCRLRHQVIDPDVVAAIQHAYSPLILVQGTPLAGLDDVPDYYATMVAHGLIPDLAVDDIVGRFAHVDEADTMDLPDGAMVIETWRTLLDDRGRILEVMHEVASARRKIYHYETRLGP